MSTEILLLLAALACADPPEEPARRPAPPPPAAHWQPRSDAALDAVIGEACRSSLADGRPVLLELSAPWCGDCQAILRMSAEPVLASELQRWHHVVVDVGRFDRHRPLIEGFGVGGIAWWGALQPTRCDEPPTRWPRLRTGTLEPATGDGPRTPAEVAAWLTEARKQSPDAHP